MTPSTTSALRLVPWLLVPLAGCLALDGPDDDRAYPDHHSEVLDSRTTPDGGSDDRTERYPLWRTESVIHYQSPHGHQVHLDLADCPAKPGLCCNPIPATYGYDLCRMRWHDSHGDAVEEIQVALAGGVAGRCEATPRDPELSDGVAPPGACAGLYNAPCFFLRAAPGAGVPVADGAEFAVVCEP